MMGTAHVCLWRAAARGMGCGPRRMLRETLLPERAWQLLSRIAGAFAPQSKAFPTTLHEKGWLEELPRTSGHRKGTYACVPSGLRTPVSSPTS